MAVPSSYNLGEKRLQTLGVESIAREEERQATMAGGLMLHGYTTNARLCPWDARYPRATWTNLCELNEYYKMLSRYHEINFQHSILSKIDEISHLTVLF